MKVVFLYFEDSVRHMLQTVLGEFQEYSVLATQSAAEAMQALEVSGGECVLFADNVFFNRAALDVFAILRDRPTLRQRVRIVGIDVAGNVPGIRERTGGIINDYLIMPFTLDRLLDVLAPDDGGRVR